ncbi:PKD domain protein,LVIVD repeat protein [Halovivax ruber XH-70]|uniref:PKD domain protein,LVIVD repeat protein n=1 Tax=Halovivax ruber (strain DSM 18193 / JCM 13892 / XH-70) TaxID=797302 RepID=L0IC06_HALRX|nr:PKD domain protein,LVIVD repeat protein [Halovivax ruber XH-70]
MSYEGCSPNRRTVLRTAGSLAGAGVIGSTGTLADRGGATTTDADAAADPIGYVDIPGTVAEGVVGDSGDVAYVAIDQGFVSVDISDPQNPTEIARRTDTGMSEILDVKEAGDRLIAVGPGNVGSPSGMGYYDVSDPANPELIEWYETSYTIHNSFLTEDIAFLINNGTADIHLIDVSTDSPSEITSWGIQASILHDIWYQDDILYMSYWDDGTVMLDVSSPSSPSMIGKVRDGSSRSPNNDHYVTLNDDATILAIGKEQLNYNPLGVELWDVSDKTDTQFLAEIEPPSVGNERTSHNLDIQNGHMYTSFYDAGVYVHDISDPSSPEEVYSWRGDGASFWTAEVAVPGEFFIGTDEAVSGGNGRLYTFPDPADGGGNESPSADFDVSPSAPAVGETVSFDGSASTDPDGSITGYEWNLGDGTTMSGETVEHSYDTAGEYTVELTVTDDSGSSDSTADTVTVGDAGGGECVDASNWPAGSGYSGYEYIEEIDVDGQVVESSDTDGYYDFTCPDVVTVQSGGSFELTLAWNDNGYDGHYANVYVDWEQNQDFSSAEETVIFENVDDDSSAATATVSVPDDAPTGSTLARIRLSFNGFNGPTATGEYGEVNDVTIVVE